jgi:hypothetical protein
MPGVRAKQTAPAHEAAAFNRSDIEATLRRSETDQLFASSEERRAKPVRMSPGVGGVPTAHAQAAVGKRVG